MTQPCPHKNCTTTFDVADLIWEYHPNGRQSKCPGCHKKIFRQAGDSRGHVPGNKSGTLVRRFRKL